QLTPLLLDLATEQLPIPLDRVPIHDWPPFGLVGRLQCCYFRSDGSETFSRVAPASCSSPVSTARSPNETLPASRLFWSRTTKRRFWYACISPAAPCKSWSSKYDARPGVMTSLTTVVWGLQHWAVHRTVSSRSVIIPTNRSLSQTRSRPTSSFLMHSAAS